MMHHLTAGGQFHTSWEIPHAWCAFCEPCDGDDCWWYGDGGYEGWQKRAADEA